MKILRKKFNFRKALRRAVSLVPTKLRNEIIRTMMKVDLNPPPELTISLAQTKAELEEAMTILHDSYVADGLMSPSSSGMRVSVYHALPSTSTFVAKWNGEVVGTLSVIRDSIFGFPSDKIFDVSKFRNMGLKIAEPSALAIRKDFRGKQNAVILFGLFKFLVEYSIKQFGVDLWVIAVNPKHVELYEAILCFKRIHSKPIANYDYVNGAPAHGFYCDLRTWEIDLATAYGRKSAEQNIHNYFFRTKSEHFIYPERHYATISDPFMTPELLDYFFNKKSELFQKLTSRELLDLHTLYEGKQYESVLPPKKAVSIFVNRRKSKRYEVSCRGQVLLSTGKAIDMKITQVSKTGFHALCDSMVSNGEPLKAKVAIGEFDVASVEIEPVWNAENMSYGFKIISASENWLTFIHHLHGDLIKVASTSSAA